MKEEIVIHNKATSIMFYVDIVFIYLFVYRPAYE